MEEICKNYGFRHISEKIFKCLDKKDLTKVIKNRSSDRNFKMRLELDNRIILNYNFW